MTSCLLYGIIQPLKIGSTLKGKNLLLGEQILFFGLNMFISFLQLYKHLNIYVNNTSYGIRREAKRLQSSSPFSLRVDPL